MAAEAVECWRAQTLWQHGETELIIIDDADDPSFPDGIDEPTIRYQMILSNRMIGEKRNLACDMARGEYIAHFDSDDYSAPERLATQLALAQQSGKAVVGFRSSWVTDGSKWWRFNFEPHCALGTSLFYRRSFWRDHQFVRKQVGEDTEFVREAANSQQLLAVDGGDLMWWRVHPGNTSPKQVGIKWTEVPAPPLAFLQAA